MTPLIALAGAVLPEIVRAVAGDRAGAVAGHVADAVQAATGTTDPEAAALALQDPAKAAELRVRLAEIAVAAEDARLRAVLADVADARGMARDLAAKRHPLAYGGAVVSLASGAFMALMLYALFSDALSGLDGTARDLTLLIVGSVLNQWSQVVQYWIGSSRGSAEKSETMAAPLARGAVR